MDKFEELAKLGELMKSWILTEEEFASEKAKVLASGVPARAAVPPAPEVPPRERFSDRLGGRAPGYALALAVSLLALLTAFVAPGLGPSREIAYARIAKIFQSVEREDEEYVLLFDWEPIRFATKEDMEEMHEYIEGLPNHP